MKPPLFFLFEIMNYKILCTAHTRGHTKKKGRKEEEEENGGRVG
jgi:hypothetical protein